MDRQLLGGLVGCGRCGLEMPLAAALVRMGSTDLFACPSCNHQEIWRNPVVEPMSAGSGVS